MYDIFLDQLMKLFEKRYEHEAYNRDIQDDETSDIRGNNREHRCLFF